jgi:hypothetical protein
MPTFGKSDIDPAKAEALRKLLPRNTRVRARSSWDYTNGRASPTRAAAPAPASAPLANAAPTRTAVAETMVAFAQDSRRRPTDAGLRKHSSAVGSSGVCNAGTACDGTPLHWHGSRCIGALVSRPVRSVIEENFCKYAHTPARVTGSYTPYPKSTLTSIRRTLAEKWGRPVANRSWHP